ncbi:Alpha/Beta hydrolase protein [Glomus cerebriforme]|uniref:Alpha/Beta hydrolase protein n=1 Tax=Glomus cerebriforme TaxID=658196 RepID=A0A397T5F1_9GLOM|nr:Alpha/Beta hydrolase protein [Glomus cerebriforme]
MATLFRDIFHHLKSNNSYRKVAKHFCDQRTSNLLTHKYLTTQFIRRAGIHNSPKDNNALPLNSFEFPPSLEDQELPPNIFENNKRSSNPPLSFPCIDQLTIRTRSLDGGPEPAYDKIISGYSLFHHSEPFLCDHGGILPELDIAYETWGELNEKRDNAILIQTGLSGSSHAKSHEKNVQPGWWEQFIGPGLSIDTNKYFVICTNVIGGCYGSTGPSSIDPSDGERYATRFPILTIFDMVRAQFLLLDYLKINKLHASVGSSMGGMQSLASAWLYPDRVSRLISISACARSHPYSIALRHTQRQVLMADPNWNKGFYYNSIPPHIGMKLAREIATISYRSGPEWEQRFGRKRQLEEQTPALCPDFLIETYLDYQGERFCLQYDPNSLLYVSKAMDLFDMSASVLEKLKRKRSENTKKSLYTESRNNDTCYVTYDKPSSISQHHHQASTKPSLKSAEKKHISSLASVINGNDLEDLVQGLSVIKQPSLILGVQSDILFPYWQQKEIAECLRMGGNKDVTYYELDSMYGHDTFLIDLTNVGSAVKGHLEFGG